MTPINQYKGEEGPFILFNAKTLETAYTNYINRAYSHYTVAPQLKLGKLLTGAILRKAGACSDGVRAFENVFPRGTYGSHEDIQRALDSDLSFGFLAFWRLHEKRIIPDAGDCMYLRGIRADYSLSLRDRNYKLAKAFFEIYNK